MDRSDIDYGFATLRLLTGPSPETAEPVGVVAWDSSREWFGVRLLEPAEVGRRIPRRRLALARLAERDLNQWASRSRVPYAPRESPPWTAEFWSAVHRFLASGVRLDSPAAMQRMTKPEEEFPLLFEAIARPRASKSRQRIGGYLRRALGSSLTGQLLSRPTVDAFAGRQETVARGAFLGRRGLIIEAVNLAATTGRRDADALVSRLERILAEQSDRRDLDVVVGYLASPGGLNGESDMRDWIDTRVAPDTTFNLVAEEQQFRRAAFESLRGMGAAGSLSLFDLVDDPRE